MYAEEDEEAFLDLKAWLKSRNDPEAASVLRFVTEFEETVEPDPRLKQFYDWLQAKGCDRTAVLARWWIAEFVEEAEKEGSVRRTSALGAKPDRTSEPSSVRLVPIADVPQFACQYPRQCSASRDETVATKLSAASRLIHKGPPRRLTLLYGARFTHQHLGRVRPE